MEQEILYLIYQYISQCTSCNNTAISFKQDLEEQGLLGRIMRWDGTSRIASLQDLQQKHKRIPPNEIVRMLQASMPNQKFSKNTSLLYQPTRIQIDRDIIDEIKSIQLKIVDLSLNLITNSQIITRNQHKIGQQQSIDNLEAPTSTLLLSSHQLSAHEDVHILTDEEVVGTLKVLGRLKNTKILENQMLEKIQENKSLTVEKQNLSSFLSTKYPEHLLSGLWRGEVDTGVNWLISRSLGRTRYGSITPSYFNLPRDLSSEDGTISLNPHSTIENALLDQYHLLWSSSGHLLHPAYCAVFDRSGRYLITGADDYLVKIWDTETGQLVKTCRGHGGHVTVIAISYDNSLMATACTTGSIRIWRLSDGKCLSLMAHVGVVNWLQFDFITGALISAGDDGHCIIWDLTCYIPFTETNCYNDEIDYEEGGRRWWVGEMSIKTSPLLQCCCLEISNSLETTTIPPTPSLPCGIFSWNRNSQSSASKLGCLSLPHLKDGLSGEPIKIFTFDVCPRDHIVATGCEDGIARIWRFNESSSNHNSTTSSALDPNFDKRADNLAKLQRMRGVLSSQDYAKLETTTLYLLARLEGHMDEVTDLKFSNLGERLCSGSLKDGTVRIWAFSKDYLKNDMLILNLNDDNEQDNIEDQPNFSRQRNRNQLSNYKTEIYNIGWSCDDQFIFVAHSKVPKKLTRVHSHQISTTLTVFNSMSGILVNSFTVSNQKSHVLAIHPQNPTIIFTGGEDGFMNIWNVERGVLISQYRLLSPPTIGEIMEPNHPVDILDASFSPDGFRIAVTDAIGRTIVLGRDQPIKYANNVFPEQYFSTDYAVVMHDANGWPIDEGTQLPLHFAPVGPLVDINHVQYNNQPKLHSFSLPLPLTSGLIIELRKELLESRSNWNRTLHLSYLALKKSKNYLNLHTVDHNQLTKNKPVIWGNKTTISNPSNRSTNIRSLANYSSSSNQTAERRRRIVISDDDVSHSIVEEDNDNNYLNDSDDDSRYERHFIPSRRSQRRRVAVSSRGRRLGTRSGGSSSPSHAGVSLPNRTRASRAVTRNLLREEEDMEVVVHQDSSDDFSSVSGETDDDNNEHVDSSDHADHADEHFAPVSENIKIKNQQNVSKKYAGWTTLRSKGSQHRIIPMGIYVERDWLLTDSPSDYQYCPQVGDNVMYFPQGHINHLNLIPEQKRPPWMSFPLKWPVVECRIVNISYDFPTQTEFNKCPSILAKLQLQLVGRPIRWGSNCRPGQIYSSFGPLRESRHTTAVDINFEVILRFSNLPDFIIPSYLYNRCTVVNWQPSLEFVSYFLEDSEEDQTTTFKEYGGIVHRVIDSDSRDWAHSPWESLEIQWKDALNNSSNSQQTDYERISPWDAIIPGTIYPSTHFYPSSLSREVQIYLLDYINALMLEETYQPFSYPVDPEVFPDYDCIIPVPMYLDLIKRRLENTFYHQISALKADVSLLLSNCKIYNMEGASIIMQAEELVEKLLNTINALKINSKSNDETNQRFESGTLEAIERDNEDITIMNEPENNREEPPRSIRRSARQTYNSDQRTAVSNNSQSDRRSRFNATYALRSSGRTTNLIEGQSNGDEETLRIRGSARSTSLDNSLHDDDNDNDNDDDSDDDQNEEEEEEEEEVNISRSRSGRVLRKKRTLSTSEDEEEEIVPPKKMQMRSQKPPMKDSNTRRTTRSSTNSEPTTSKSRSSLRSRIVQKSSQSTADDEEDDDDEEDEEEDDDESHNDSVDNKRNGKKEIEENEDSDEASSSSSSTGSSSSSSSSSSEENHERKEINKHSSRPRTRNSQNKFPISTKETSSRSIRNPPSTRTTRTRHNQMIAVLDKAVELDRMEIFHRPVDPKEFPEYHQLIQKPMDFSTIRKNISKGNYQTFQEFVNDLMLIFQNCEEFNAEGSQIFKESKRQQREMKKFIQTLN